MKILKEIRKFLTRFKNELGYTLMEVAAVVAITATLTAVVVPIVIYQIDNAKKQAAIGGCHNIASAIGNFMKDAL